MGTPDYPVYYQELQSQLLLRAAHLQQQLPLRHNTDDPHDFIPIPFSRCFFCSYKFYIYPKPTCLIGSFALLIVFTLLQHRLLLYTQDAYFYPGKSNYDKRSRTKYTDERNKRRTLTLTNDFFTWSIFFSPDQFLYIFLPKYVLFFPR